MNIGVCLWCLPDRSPASLELAKELGFDGVELDMNLGRPEDLRTEHAIADYRAAAANAGISIPSVALNGIRMKEAKHFDEACELGRAAIRAASRLGAVRLQVPSFFGDMLTTDEEFLAASRVLRQLCDDAAPLGIRVGSENQLDVPGNRKLMEMVDRENFFHYFDTGNPIWLDRRDAPAMLRELYPVTEESHAKDLITTGGASRYVPLGTGDCRFEESFRFLRDSCFTGWLLDENELPPELLRKDAERMRSQL